MNRGMMGVQHHGQNLYGLDAMRRKVFDRKSHYDAHSATEKRYPLYEPRQESEGGGVTQKTTFSDAPRGQARSARSAASETRVADGRTPERASEWIPGVIYQLLLAMQQLKEKIAAMKREAKGEGLGNL